MVCPSRMRASVRSAGCMILYLPWCSDCCQLPTGTRRAAVRVEDALDTRFQTPFSHRLLLAAGGQQDLHLGVLRDREQVDVALRIAHSSGDEGEIDAFAVVAQFAPKLITAAATPGEQEQL